MDSGSDGDSETRFAAYVEQLGTALGHADRQEPLRDYCLGLLMPIERKSVEPMAAVTAPGQVAAKHQSLLHFVRPSCCGAMASTTRSASRRSPTSCRARSGTISPGARAARIGWPRASPACGHARR